MAAQTLIWAAHSLAHLEIVRHGEVYEEESIYKALEYEPEFFQTIYLDVITKRKTKKLLTTALTAIDEFLETHAEEHLKPLLKYLAKENRVVPLSELGEHFAHTQLYPWHLESACEWLERKQLLEKGLDALCHHQEEPRRSGRAGILSRTKLGQSADA